MTGPTSSSSSSGMSSPLKTTYRSPTLDHLLVPPLAFPDAAALNHRQVTAAQPDRKALALEDEQIAGFELRPVDLPPFGHDTEPPDIRHRVGEVRYHEELAAWLDDPAQLVCSALAIGYVVPDEEQQGCVTRGIWQRDVLARPSRIRDGGMAGMGKGLSTHLV